MPRRPELMVDEDKPLRTPPREPVRTMGRPAIPIVMPAPSPTITPPSAPPSAPPAASAPQAGPASANPFTGEAMSSSFTPMEPIPGDVRRTWAARWLNQGQNAAPGPSTPGAAPSQAVTGPTPQPPAGPLMTTSALQVGNPSPIPGVDQPAIPDRPYTPPPDVAAALNTPAIQAGLNRQMDAGTQAIADRGAIVADGTYNNAVRSGVSPEQARAMFGAPRPSAPGSIPASAYGTPNGGIGISAMSQRPLSPDAQRAFAENQTLSVRQGKAAEQRGRYKQAANQAARAGDVKGATALRGQGAAITSPSARTAYDVQQERDRTQRELAMEAIRNPVKPAPGNVSQPKVTTKEDILSNAARGGMSADDLAKLKQTLDGVPTSAWSAFMRSIGEVNTSPTTQPTAPTQTQAASPRMELNGRIIVVRNGKWVYEDTGEPAQ